MTKNFFNPIYFSSSTRCSQYFNVFYSFSFFKYVHANDVEKILKILIDAHGTLDGLTRLVQIIESNPKVRWDSVVLSWQATGALVIFDRDLSAYHAYDKHQNMIDRPEADGDITLEFENNCGQTFSGKGKTFLYEAAPVLVHYIQHKHVKDGDESKEQLKQVVAAFLSNP